MSKQESKNRNDNKNFGWNLTNTIIAVLGFLLALFMFFQHGYEINNLKKLNKQHLDPNLMLMVSKNADETDTIMVKNTEIVPVVEIYVIKNIYDCSVDDNTIYSVTSEDPGWHITELAPQESKTKIILSKEDKLQIMEYSRIAARGRSLKSSLEPVIEFYVEFHRQSDFKNYSFRQMYFLKDLDLIWSEDSRVKDDLHYNELYNLVRNYKRSRKYTFPKIEDVGKY